MSTEPVVAHGASGYTGRIICEYLRELNVPFVGPFINCGDEVAEAYLATGARHHT